MSLPIMTALPGESRGYVDGPDGQIHYRSHGEGATVILVHQAPWSSIQYRRVLPRLSAAGFRAIAIDLPGHGMSDPPPEPSVERYALAVDALVRQLDCGRVAIVGHRGGGLVAGRFAAENPQLVRGLVLDNAPCRTAAERAAQVGRFPDRQDIAPDGSHLTDRWAWVRRVGDPDWSDETVHISVLTYFMHGPWKEHGHSVIALYDFEQDLSRIAAPTLVIGSRSDPVFESASRLCAARPDWDYAELPGGPGMVLDRPDEWLEPVLPFLLDHMGAASERADRTP